MELAENCLAHFLIYLISHGVQAKAKRRSHKLWSHALIPTVNTDSALFFQDVFYKMAGVIGGSDDLVSYLSLLKRNCIKSSKIMENAFNCYYYRTFKTGVCCPASIFFSTHACLDFLIRL